MSTLNTVTVNRSTPIRASSAPNLPVAPTAYQQTYFDQFANSLRLYFAQVDNFTQALLTNIGGSSISFPYAQIEGNTTNQYATTANTPTLVTWNKIDAAKAFTVTSNVVVIQQSGYYNFSYTLQLANTDTTAHTAIVWARLNNVDIAGSTAQYTVPASGKLSISATQLVYLTAGSGIGIWWGTDKAATSGGATGVLLQSQAAQTSPMAYPQTPAALGVITFVSAS
jgi:hypothetical protein